MVFPIQSASSAPTSSAPTAPQLHVATAGEALFELLIDVASGQRTWAERWGLHNALTLFNPAPVT